MKKTTVLDGQIDLFSLTIQEPITKPKEKVIIEKQEMEKDTFINIINLYKESCSRIVKTVSGALLVELEDKTKYFNGQGIHEFDLGIDIGLMPSDEIIIVNKEKCFNDIQMEKLKGINPTKYIKRKGDANLIIPLHDKTIVINPRGWVIEWKQKPIYKDNEVVILETTLDIGDKVEFTYNKEIHKGKIATIYNNGETVNVIWNGKHTAFYYKCVKKIA